jgi:hypothetical protein
MDYLLPAPASITQLDDLANFMERKWGIDRLTRLVPPEAQARWLATLEACQSEWTPQADKDAMMMRAWRGMDAAATAAGAKPLPPGLWEQRADDGTIVVICRDNEHAQVEILRAKHDGRTVATWTLAEVVRVVMAANGAVINQIKTTWPGATVERQRPMPTFDGDDPVPTFDGDDPVPSFDSDDVVMEGASEASDASPHLPYHLDPQRASVAPQNASHGHPVAPPPPPTKRGRKGTAK